MELKENHVAMNHSRHRDACIDRCFVWILFDCLHCQCIQCLLIIIVMAISRLGLFVTRLTVNWRYEFADSFTFDYFWKIPFESVCALNFEKRNLEKRETRAVKSFSIFSHIVFIFYDFPSIKTETKRLTKEIYRWPFNMCIIASFQCTTRSTACQRRKWRWK